jgi:hypothetical protein
MAGVTGRAGIKLREKELLRPQPCADYFFHYIEEGAS